MPLLRSPPEVHSSGSFQISHQKLLVGTSANAVVHNVLGHAICGRAKVLAHLQGRTGAAMAGDEIEKIAAPPRKSRPPQAVLWARGKSTVCTPAAGSSLARTTAISAGLSTVPVEFAAIATCRANREMS